MRNVLKKIVTAAVALSMLPAVGIIQPAYADDTVGTVIRLDPSNASPFNDGEFQGWGTSLCWWANRLGYSEELTQQAADAFFSEDGLGLDIARYNLGGGDDPTHNHITRSDSKVPGVWDTFELSEEGKDVTSITYDITNDQNQLNIAKAAKAANPDIYFEGFSNSAPYFMTQTGCTSGGTAKTKSNGNDKYSDENNLKDDFYDDFGRFIADATKLFKDNGIEFRSYSPMNEPDTDYWYEESPKQEGCHFDPGESQSNAIIETRKALDRAGLTNVLVAGMDETSIDKSVTNYAKLSDEAKTSLGRIDTHTYSGSNRSGLKQTATDAGKNLWMSEVDGGWNGLGLAERIITDLNGMQASAWVMWDIVDSHKDSSFETPDGTKSEASNSLDVTGSLWGVGMADHDTETLELANKYYFFGQFTKYINPGDTLIASSNSTLAAYNKKSGDIKIVALNSGDSDKKCTFDLSPFTSVGSTVKEIRTNNLTGTSAEHWKEITGEASLSDKKLSTTLKAGTVTTYVLSGDNPTLLKTPVTMDENGLSYSYYNIDTGSGVSPILAVYDENHVLKDIFTDGTGSVNGDFSNCTYKLLVWDKNLKPLDTALGYAVINGGSDEIEKSTSVNLSLDTNIKGNVTWSVSDTSVASITQDGVLTAKNSGSVTVSAAVDGFTVTRSFTVPSYKLSGTASWSNTSNAPSDSNDYTHAADGDLTTYFDGTTGGYVQYDFGTVVRVKSIKLAARSGDGMPARTVGAKIQGSGDGITWTDLYTISSAISAGTYTTINASSLASTDYRYFRYTNTTNMANIAEFQIDADPVDAAALSSYYPKVYDIPEFTDNFESSTNIFDAAQGTLSGTGNVVFDSGLDRFGNVFAPAKSTATSTLSEPIALTANDTFRLTFNMFAGWEDKGKDNSFILKDKDGNELAAIYMTGGGYNFNQIRIGGQNVLSDATVAQCRSNWTGNKLGANGWGHTDQPYRNNVGYNKTVEITISGSGEVSVSATGGMADTAVSSTLTGTVTIGSIELVGDYASAAGRTVSYDNFDGDIITAAQE